MDRHVCVVESGLGVGERVGFLGLIWAAGRRDSPLLRVYSPCPTHVRLLAIFNFPFRVANNRTALGRMKIAGPASPAPE